MPGLSPQPSPLGLNIDRPVHYFMYNKNKSNVLDCSLLGWNRSFIFDQRVAANWRWTWRCRIPLRYNNRTTETSRGTGRWKWKVRILIIHVHALHYLLLNFIGCDGLMVRWTRSSTWRSKPWTGSLYCIRGQGTLLSTKEYNAIMVTWCNAGG